MIVNWKSADYLSGCLDSLRSQTAASLRVVVIDNGSGAAERAILEGLPVDDLILNPINRGFAAAVNQGLEGLNEEFVFLLNPDTRLLDSALDELIRFLRRNPRASAVAPALYSVDGRRQRSLLPLPSPFGLWLRLLPPLRLASGLRWTLLARRSRRVSGVWGAAVVFRREVFARIGGFDERFFLYVEDSDFFRRMKRAGLLTFYLPAARITHYGGISQSRSATDRDVLNWNNLVRYFHKYHSPLGIRINVRILRALMRLENLFRPGFWSPAALEILKGVSYRSTGPACSTVPVEGSSLGSNLEDL